MKSIKISMSILKEKDGTYSWRKIITCYAVMQITVSINAHQFFEFNVLPDKYFYLLYMIIAFYFGKDLLKKQIKEKKNESKD